MQLDVNITIGTSTIPPSASCRNLGVMFDKNACMDDQITSLCRSAHFHLRNIRAIRNLLTDSAAAQLVHALVTARIDYCNSLLYGIPDYKLTKLQRVHIDWRKLHKKQHVSAFFGKSVLKCHLT